MSVSKFGVASAVVSRVSARAAAVAALLGLAGCATSSHPYSAQNAAIAGSSRVAEAAQVEDEGRPAQAVPTTRVRELADDPGEPYSKSYGGNNPSAGKKSEPGEPSRAPIPTAKIPADLPPAFRRKLASAMLPDE